MARRWVGVNAVGGMRPAAADRGTVTRRRSASALLVTVCRGEAVRGTDRADHDDIVVAARHHRVAPLVHVALRDGAPLIADTLKDDRDRAVAVHLGATTVLHDLDHTLGDLPWVVFKGPVLSEHAHPIAGLRTYQDVDILIDPRDLRHVTAQLAAAGWTLLDYDDMLRAIDPPGEMHWRSPVGLQVDLHWSMINMAGRRDRFNVSTVDLLDRRRQQSLGLTKAWTLDPVDALVHVCLHAALSGADRMLLLLDADHLARQVTDWADVASRARQWRAQAAVAVVLRRARRYLGTPIPDRLDRSLGISVAFRTVTGAADRITPVPSLRREASVPRLVSKAARPGAGPTLAAVGRNAAIGVRERLGPTPPPPERMPASEAALEHFLSRVEKEAQR